MRTALLVFCLLLTLAACGPSPEQQAAYTATAMTATAAAWTPTPTVTHTPTATLTPTPTVTPTPTLTPTETSTPNPTQDPDRFYPPDNSFSIVGPGGWESVDLGLKYPALMDPRLEYKNQNLAFVSEVTTYSLEEYAGLVQANIVSVMQDVTELDEDIRTTSSGLEYFYWVIENTQNNQRVRQYIYIFKNQDLMLTILYTRMAGEMPDQDALVDQAIDTFRFEP